MRVVVAVVVVVLLCAVQVFSVAKIRSKILTFPGKNTKGIILNARLTR